MTKTTSRSTVTVGDSFTYTLTVRNAGPDSADGVTVSDSVPSELDVRSASASRGACSVKGNKVVCALGELAGGKSASVTVEVLAVRAGMTTNVAVVAGPKPPTPADPVFTPLDPSANNRESARVRVIKPRLSLSKRVNRASLSVGESATYTIEVRNLAKLPVQDVRVCDYLPSRLEFVGATAKVRMSSGGFCWTIKRLGALKSVSYSLTARALPGAAVQTVNRATAGAGGVKGVAGATQAVRVLPSATAGDGVTG